MKNDNTKRHVLEGVLVNLSLLHHARLSEDERRASRKNMDDLIMSMDARGVSYQLQNSLFYIAQQMDVRACYLSDMLRAAFDRIGVTCPF